MTGPRLTFTPTTARLLYEALLEAERMLTEVLGRCEPGCTCVLHPVRAALQVVDRKHREPTEKGKGDTP